MGKNHLFLKNEFGVCLEFNKTRGRNDEEEASNQVKNYRTQRNILYSCCEDFHTAKSRRHSRRQNNLDLSHLDLLSMDFLKVADSELIRRFDQTYGLSAVNFSNMNQSVLFVIADETRFQEVFIPQIERFYEEENDANTEYRLLTLISRFRYSDSDSIKSPTVSGENARNIIFELIDSNARISQKHRFIEASLIGFLKAKKVVYSELDHGIFQVDFIESIDLNYILDNYDVIQRVESLYTVRVRPNIFGEKETVSDATLTLKHNGPTIGVIDTGVHKLAVLEPILSDDGIDLLDSTNPKPYEIDIYNDSFHGTTVATLASFGNTFYEDIEAENIEADAKIFSIKVQSGETGYMNIAGIKEAIKKAHNDYGIRIFNLSMSVGCKNYNEDISTYAYILDMLAYEYDILIFIAVGNLNTDDIDCIQDIASRNTTSETVKNFLKYPNHYYNPLITLDESECHVCECMNLCVPSDSMNNMSVGAIAENKRPNPNTLGLTLGKDYPAYYSRKYYIDYNALINGTRFKNNQKNKNLFKPDIVMPGGDQLDNSSKMAVLAPRYDGAGLRIIENSGTSYASPLAANIAAKVLCKYPELNMQSVKALIINSTTPISKHYLDDTIENLKTQENDQYPNVDKKIKTQLSNKYSVERLSKYLSGHGVPDIAKCIESDDNRCTFVIEESIVYDSNKVVNLNIPDYLLLYTKKDAIITLTATLCYKFKPVHGNALSYCPLHISFNFGNSINFDEPKKNAEMYARYRASTENDQMAIKGKFSSWSDDFYPASSKMFSNVQKMSLNITRDEIEKIQNQLSIIFRCTGRDELIDSSNPFSFVLTIEQKRTAELDGNSLYDSLEQVNAVQIINDVALEAEINS
ncbi:MAG: S8 family peptidase [Phocaeicola sp.]